MKIFGKNLNSTALAIGVVLFIAGLGIGYGAGNQKEAKRLISILSQIHPVRQANSSYPFISPLLAYNIPEAVQLKEYKNLEDKLNAYIAEQKYEAKASNISVYFQDLNQGRWVGIDENQQYQPASMMKVVIMIAYFKEAENNPALLNQTLTYTTQYNQSINNIPFEATSTLAVGKSYTVEQLIESMIMSSDNGAMTILLNNIDSNSLDAVYTDLGFATNPDTTPGADPYTISAKSYALFLRVLYNATYLNEAMSEKALEFLSRAAYHDGLVAGVPPGTAVAQKFGEHIYDQNGRIIGVGLHNCGIIYGPHPYLLCVMTKGTQVDDLTQVISGISQMVYSDVQAQR